MLAALERTAPFHPGPASYRRAGIAEVVVQGVGPGIFPGDRLETEVTVGAGAALIVRGQGATKVFPSPSGEAAVTVTRLRVEAGGWLVWLPGELIPFRDAVLRQETSVELTEEARLALAEIVTPGRLAMGERDAFARLDLRLRIAVASRPVLVEGARLDPGRRPLASPGRHGSFACAGALYLAGCGAGDLGQGEPGAAVWWGSGRSSSADLTLVRLLGPTAQGVRGRIDDLLARAGCLGRPPNPQSWGLSGR